MALTREEKEEILKAYGEQLESAQVLIWAHYRGLVTPRVNELRRQLRSSGAEAMVVKNTLMRLALERANLPVSPELVAGPCMVAFVKDDIPAVSKTVNDFARANENMFQLVGGLVGGKLATAEQIRSLSTLPSQEVLLSQVLGSLQAPISGFVGTLAAVLRGLLNVLDARGRQLQGSEG